MNEPQNSFGSDGSNIVTVKQAAERRPAFSQAALRDLKFKAFDRTNSRGDVIPGNGSGEAGVWIEVGSKVLVDLEAFDGWIQSKRVVRPTPKRRVAASGGCHASV